MQARRAARASQRRSGTNIAHPSLLAGLVFDQTGEPLTPSHAAKGGVRYRYYVSRSLITGLKASHPEGWRIPAPDLEGLVIDKLTAFLSQEAQLLEVLPITPTTDIQGLIAKAGQLTQALRDNNKAMETTRSLIAHITISPDQVTLEIKGQGLTSHLGLNPNEATPNIPITIRARLRRHGRAVRLVLTEDGEPLKAPDIDQALTYLLKKAHGWWKQIRHDGVSVTDLARRERVTPSYVSRIVRLAFLAPDISEAIFDGTQPSNIRVKSLCTLHQLPTQWADQRRLLGFASSPEHKASSKTH